MPSTDPHRLDDSRRSVFSAGRLALFLVVGVLFTCSGCARDPLRLRVVGNQLVNGSGQPIRLLGVNRSGSEYGCLYAQGVFAGPTNRWAIKAMAAWRINAVRIPLNETCWLGINGVPDSYSGITYQSAVRRYVRQLNRAGLYVVLDLHWNAPGASRATGQQPMADLDHAPAFWASVARTFRREPAVAFDLYNEPHGVSWRCWRDGCKLPDGWFAAGMQTLVNAVRSAGTTQPIIATGLDWGSELDSWLMYRPHDPANQLAAGLHAYDTVGCRTARCWEAQVASVARRVPVVATELGEKGCTDTFIDRFMRWADLSGVSYLAWTWNPYGCAAPALISTWNGSPTRYGEGFRAHLMALR